MVAIRVKTMALLITVAFGAQIVAIPLTRRIEESEGQRTLTS